jgi:site-specific DNA-methyltransferase (adenine-specific)
VSSLFEQTYNPDVLSCLANLSNDEVFTPPELANQMLDLLPDELWSDPNAKFLDPACKSGVFLREIAKRLIEGLEAEYPDLQERLDHIYHEQLYGIAITELTSLLSRRSLYCSKYPNGKYSIVKFDGPEGNVRFRNVKHTWANGRCIYCGAAEKEYSRDSALEQHAYEFIHSEYPRKILNMKFDVIVGNPPYQMGDGGAQQSAVPIYQNFIEKAKELNPRYITMIVPARWYAGGRGLDDFRKSMLTDDRLRVLHDFPETSDCFAGINIRGGVCYFLWERDSHGDCHVYNHRNGRVNDAVRPLLEDNSDIFIRYNQSIAILRKVQELQEPSFGELVSSSKPFGLRGFFKEYSPKRTADKPIKLYRFGDDGFVSREQVVKNREWIDQWKVIVPEASPGGDEYPHLVLSVPKISEPGSICTETYLVMGPFGSELECNNVASYIKTKFFRFMVLMIKNTQHTTKKVYRFVPQQDFSKVWTDEALYEKYGIDDQEQLFIDSLVKER